MLGFTDIEKLGISLKINDVFLLQSATTTTQVPTLLFRASHPNFLHMGISLINKMLNYGKVTEFTANFKTVNQIQH